MYISILLLSMTKYIAKFFQMKNLPLSVVQAWVSAILPWNVDPTPHLQGSESHVQRKCYLVQVPQSSEESECIQKNIAPSQTEMHQKNISRLVPMA